MCRKHKINFEWEKQNMNKKVLMVTDLEGISGIAKIEQVMDTDSPDYIHSREYLMADVNAAIAGCFDGGAEAVYVWDGHGGGVNFIPGTLDARATQIDGNTIMGVVRDCDVLMLVGMHAMSGTAKAFLDHTQSSKTIFDYKYNGIRRGEITQECIFAGYFGIPCVMVTGDRAACREAEALLPGVITAEVKSAEVRNVADCLPFEEAHKRIHDAAVAGMALEGREAFDPGFPLTIEVTFTRADYCDMHDTDWRERVDARTMRRVSHKIESYYDILI